jgi:nucleotide-binding universal stress UspA family protein
MVRSVDQEVDRIELLAEQYMGPLVRELRRQGIEANPIFELAPEPAGQIVRLAKAVEADLIVMATHGRSGLDRLRHGSVTEQVLRHSDIPLLAFGRMPLKSLLAREAPAPAMASSTSEVAHLNLNPVG